ncbi:glutathionylspermidine synthase family protein [Paractinoplanes rishiriensis]|uniref:Uncharacterized protein n=1 Tax=Paractinoplanes rishiriensis TaxID=1050105 RepID=A0A919KBQ8_9ACTN|nr:glutathionylspermidine synthase family protein [Actinoplanes rishiriensis]GIF02304.1 hypothetical protein Ari01nite_97680 [Actinoplanes rishiriensis]
MISYWEEGPYYDFAQAEIEELETATATLNTMCIKAGNWDSPAVPPAHRAGA